MKTTVVVLLLLAASLHAQKDKREPIPSRSDRDFKVEWQSLCCKADAHYKATIRENRILVRGKGKLIEIRKLPEEGGWPVYLLTVEGIQDHAIWRLRADAESIGMWMVVNVKFWKLGDIIRLDTYTGSADKSIPEIQYGSGSAAWNLTRPACDVNGCPDKNGNR